MNVKMECPLCKTPLLSRKRGAVKNRQLANIVGVYKEFKRILNPEAIASSTSQPVVLNTAASHPVGEMIRDFNQALEQIDTILEIPIPATPKPIRKRPREEEILPLAKRSRTKDFLDKVLQRQRAANVTPKVDTPPSTVILDRVGTEEVNETHSDLSLEEPKKYICYSHLTDFQIVLSLPRHILNSRTISNRLRAA